MTPSRSKLGLLLLLLTSFLFTLHPQIITAQPTSQTTIADFKAVADTQRTFSIQVPSTWSFTSMPADAVYTATLLAAENPTMLEDLRQYHLGMQTRGNATGNFVVINRLSADFWRSFATNVQEAAPTLIRLLSESFPVYDQRTVEFGADNYSVTFIETEIAELSAYGIIGAFAHNGELFLLQLMVSPIDAPEAQFELLEVIGDSLSVPAGAGALTERGAEQLPAATPAGPVDTVGTPGELLQINAEDDVLSAQLPSEWLFLDRTATDDLFIYADTQAALDARLYSLHPSLYNAPVAMAGVGGVIEIYALSEVGLSADNPDVSGLMTQLLAGLAQQGYEVVEEPSVVRVGGNEGQMAVIRGSEHGFLALVPFGDQLAYITGTGTGASGGFEANRDLLSEIIASIHIPAAIPEPAATAAPGLGGLGGLRGGEAAATPAPGLGGLGGLSGGLGGAATPAPGA